MAGFARVRNLLFSQPSKRFSRHFVYYPASSSDLNAFNYPKKNFMLSNSIKEKALYFLNSCTRLTHLFQIQAYIITLDLFQDPSFSGRLLKLSSELSDDFSYTILIFRCIDCPDAFCINRIIKHYSCSGNHEKAVVFYIEMLRNNIFSPNCFTFPPLISTCAKLRCLSLGQMCHGQALKLGVDGVLPVHNSFIHLYVSCGKMAVALKLFDGIHERDLVSWNTMIEGFAKEGNMDMAHNLFDAMREKNVVSWNVMIGGYLNFQNPGVALKLFRKMMSLGFKSDYTAIVNVLTACGRSNRLKEGRSVHSYLVKVFRFLNSIVDSAIIHMYSKCGMVDHARIIFDRMPSKNLVSWNVMILGYCIHANPVDGLNLYAEMVGKIKQQHKLNLNSDMKANLDGKGHILPDEVTFIGVLCACAREGMLTEARNYFSQMVDVFHVKPNFAHYWCMANLMAGVGLMQEAVDILKNIPVDIYDFPESSLWAELLGLCRFVGDVNSGEQIAKDFIKQDPQNFFHYALLVNIYAVAGRWEEVDKTKSMMKDRGIRRVPGCDLKDLKEVVHNTRLTGKWYPDLQITLMK